MSEVVILTFKETGADTVVNQTDRIAKGLDGVENSSKSAYSALGYLKNVLQLVAGAFAIEKLRAYSDTYTTLISRLKLVSSSTENLRQTEQRLFDISQQTRSSYEATANLYSRLANATRGQSINQKQLLALTEQVNQAIAVSGASATEAAGGIIQLSQGLASGALRGDELRSVLENFPYLGQQIAKGMGVGLGALRQLGEQGKITTKSILDALQKQAPEIAKAFANFRPTISQAFTVLNNSVLRFIGLMDQSSGFSGILAQSILRLANNLSTLVQIVTILTASFLALRTAMAISTVYSLITAVASLTTYLTALNLTMATSALSGYAAGFSTMSLAMTGAASSATFLGGVLVILRGGLLALWGVVAAHPFLALITVLTAVGLAIYNFGQQLKLTADGSITAYGVLAGTFNTVSQAVSVFVSWLGQLISWIYQSRTACYFLLGAITTLTVYFVGMQVVSLLSFLGGLVGILYSVATAMLFLATNPLTLIIAGFTAGAAIVAYFTGTLDSLIDKLYKAGNTIKNTISEAIKEASKNMKDAGNSALSMGNNIKKGADTGTAALQNLDNTSQNVADSFRSTWRPAEYAISDPIEAGVNSAIGDLERLKSEMKEVASQTSSVARSASGGGGGGDINFSFQNPDFFRQSLQAADQLSLRGNSLGARERLTAVYDVYYNAYGKPGPNNDPSFYPEWYRNLKGFRYGGDFTVGGRGGPDSQLVQFMATPGEQVSITPRSRRGSTESSRPAPNISINIVTKDADSFRRDKQQTLTKLGIELTKAMTRG